MNPFGNDLKTSWEVVYGLKPQLTAATSNDGPYVDCKDYDGPMMAIVATGVCTDGNYLPALEEDDDGSGTGTTITPYKGSFETIASNNDDEIVTVMFKRTKRYVRVVMPETSAGSTGVNVCILLLGRKKNV